MTPDVATDRYGSRMSPNQPKTPPRQIRIPNKDWADFAAAAETAGSERSALIRAFVDWYLTKPAAKLPRRPNRADWVDPE